jgi:hypothetical protein
MIGTVAVKPTGRRPRRVSVPPLCSQKTALNVGTGHQALPQSGGSPCRCRIYGETTVERIEMLRVLRELAQYRPPATGGKRPYHEGSRRSGLAIPAELPVKTWVIPPWTMDSTP